MKGKLRTDVDSDWHQRVMRKILVLLSVSGVLLPALCGCESADDPAKNGPSGDTLVSALSPVELQAFCAEELAKFDAWPALASCATPTDAEGEPVASDANLNPVKPELDACVQTPPACSVAVVRKCWRAWATDPCTMTQDSNACSEFYDCMLSQTDKSGRGQGKCEQESPGQWYCQPMKNDHGVYISARVKWDQEASNQERGWRVHVSRINDLGWWQDFGNWGVAFLNLTWFSQNDPYPRTAKYQIPREQGNSILWDYLHLPVDARYVAFSISGYDEWTPWALWSREFSDVWFELNSLSLGWQSGDIYVQFHYKPY